MSCRRYLLLLLLLIFIVTLFIGTAACKNNNQKVLQETSSDVMPIPRADPGYVQYLEKQSMLANANTMAKVVSGSELAWRSPGTVGNPDELLNYADTWLAVNPLTLLGNSRLSTFEMMRDVSVKTIMREIGTKGLYVAPISGSGNLWAPTGAAKTKAGDDIVQYSFTESAGTEQQYKQLMSGLIEQNHLLGSDLVPAATGLGPDFFLAARNLREYPGAYCMVEIPNEMWPQLPAAANEWDTVALTNAQVDALSSKGLLPKAMRDETSALARKAGWAVTGEVRGLDGRARRWVYRYYITPRYAVLNWEDPSQAAHRILSGSAVRQVGMLGQALIGLKLEAFQGLEAAPSNPSALSSFSVEPALSAAQSLSREIHRYGGWTWLRDDDLPVPTIKHFLASGTDFIFNSAYSPAAEHALLTGDATLLRFMTDELLNQHIDTRRLVHAMPSEDGLNYTLPHLSYLETRNNNDKAAKLKKATVTAMLNKANQQQNPLVKDHILYTTSVGLAAMALGVPAHDIPTAQAAKVTNGHSLLIMFKAMQPGILMLTGQDIVGAMPLYYQSMVPAAAKWDPVSSNKGTYGLTSIANNMHVGASGMAKTKTLYPPADEQALNSASFVSSIGSFIRARNELGLSKGKLIARPETRHNGAIAIISELPGNKGHVITVCNFSRSNIKESISLNTIGNLSAANKSKVLAGTQVQHAINNNMLQVSLDAWQGISLHISGSTSRISVQKNTQSPLDERMIVAATPIPDTVVPELIEVPPIVDPVVPPKTSALAVEKLTNKAAHEENAALDAEAMTENGDTTVFARTTIAQMSETSSIFDKGYNASEQKPIAVAQRATAVEIPQNLSDMTEVPEALGNTSTKPAKTDTTVTQGSKKDRKIDNTILASYNQSVASSLDTNTIQVASTKTSKQTSSAVVSAYDEATPGQRQVTTPPSLTQKKSSSSVASTPLTQPAVDTTIPPKDVTVAAFSSSKVPATTEATSTLPAIASSVAETSKATPSKSTSSAKENTTANSLPALASAKNKSAVEAQKAENSESTSQSVDTVAALPIQIAQPALNRITRASTINRATVKSNQQSSQVTPEEKKKEIAPVSEKKVNKVPKQKVLTLAEIKREAAKARKKRDQQLANLKKPVDISKENVVAQQKTYLHFDKDTKQLVIVRENSIN